MKTCTAQDPLFLGLKLSRNKGHQNALLAGLMTAKEYADVTISMDADLQDDVHVIDKIHGQVLRGLRYRLRCPQFPEKGYVFQKIYSPEFLPI